MGGGQVRSVGRQKIVPPQRRSAGRDLADNITVAKALLFHWRLVKDRLDEGALHIAL